MRRASEIEELQVWEQPGPAPLGLAAFKKALRLAWFRKFGNKCWPCGRPMRLNPNAREEDNYATIDHIVARSLGGESTLYNTQIICRRCNNKKSAEEYRQKNLD